MLALPLRVRALYSRTGTRRSEGTVPYLTYLGNFEELRVANLGRRTFVDCVVGNTPQKQSSIIAILQLFPPLFVDYQTSQIPDKNLPRASALLKEAITRLIWKINAPLCLDQHRNLPSCLNNIPQITTTHRTNCHTK